MSTHETTSARPDGRCEIVLFHSALGVRPAVRDWAERLRAAGHVVHVPDFYDGETFDDMAQAMKKVEALGGIEALMTWTQAVVANLPADLVYAGFSNGAGSAELLAATRPGARGAVLMHGAMPLEAFGASAWPSTVPVQLHYALDDAWRDQGAVDALASSVRASGARFESFDYPGTGHLFADHELPDFNGESAELMFKRVTGFLALLPRQTA